MANFFKQPDFKPADPNADQQKVDRQYKSMRLKVFLGAFLGYAGYYLVRKNLSLAAPDMIKDGILDAGKAGLAMSAVSIAYAFSKFIMGAVSDRSDARKFLSVGLVLSALTMIAVGVLPFGANTALNTAVIFALMLVVGWLSGMGWPPCGRIMANWFSQNERSFKMSIWNVSHTIGSFSLGFLAIAGVAICADMGMSQSWRGNFIFPAVIAILIAVFCWWAIRDTPQSMGLPSVGDWRNDHSGVKSKSEGEKLPFKVLFVDYVLKNRLLWIVALSNIFVYTVRYGIGDWAPTFLQNAGIMTAAESKIAFSIHNLIGALGTILCGLATSKIFKGRCAPMNVICMAACMVGVLIYWVVGAGFIEMSAPMQKVLVYVALCLIGFFIYGPVALTGVQALNLVPKNAAGTAAGFVGLFGYFIGDAVCSKIIVGGIANSAGWNAANLTVAIGAAIGVVLCAILIPSEKKLS
ncbi:MAG: MFS transporter [Bacteroidales bacterium]|nr:MFS transporter [Candidatus Cryptobacteroides onthequi]